MRWSSPKWLECDCACAPLLCAACRACPCPPLVRCLPDVPAPAPPLAQSQSQGLGWWRWALGGMRQVMRPVSLLQMVQFVGGLPFPWARAARTAAERVLNQEWSAMLVAASAQDGTRILRSREMWMTATRAQWAKVPLVPVLLTSSSVTARQQVRCGGGLREGKVAAVAVTMPAVACGCIGDGGHMSYMEYEFCSYFVPISVYGV